VETRWNQLKDVADRLIFRGPVPKPPGYLTLFERVRKVVKDNQCFMPSKPKSAAAAAAAAAAEADDDDDHEAVVRQGGHKVLLKTLLQRVRDAYEVDVPQAQRTYHAELECWLVHVLAPDLDRFIRQGSSDPSNFPVKIFDELAEWRKNLVNAATNGLQSIVMSKVYELSNYAFSVGEAAALLDKYKGPIKSAATEALRMYDKYIPAVKDFVRHRLRFEPSTAPDEYPLPKDDEQLHVPDVARFFGAEEKHVSLHVVIDWRTYCEKWPTINPALKALPCAQFWSHEEVKGWFQGPQLCALGRWYAETPITNVPSERAFAIMRASEGHLRHALTEESMTEELSAKCNDWVVEDMLRRQNQHFRGGGGGDGQ